MGGVYERSRRRLSDERAPRLPAEPWIVGRTRARTRSSTRVSHELRTPLAAILGSARTLQDLTAVLGDEDRAALLASVVRNARKLDRLVTDLLDIDRMDRGAATLDLAEVDLAKLVMNARRRRAWRTHTRGTLGPAVKM